jgi:chorismate synthase
MSHNTFGHLFRVTTWGESHGPAIGCVVDGCPPRIPISEAEIQAFLDKRRPGQSRFTTQRREPDQVRILSGVFEDEHTGGLVTTGTPIALQIDNVDQRSKDYSDIRERYRPGHADYTYDVKYGVRDYRGGGRSSARETAMRVAAGAIARKVVPGLAVRGALVRIGEIAVDSLALGLARGRQQSVLLPRRPNRRTMGRIPRWHTQGRLLRRGGR